MLLQNEEDKKKKIKLPLELSCEAIAFLDMPRKRNSLALCSGTNKRYGKEVAQNWPQWKVFLILNNFFIHIFYRFASKNSS